MTYIRTTPEKLWQALMEPEFTRQYWVGTTQECAWKPGAAWKLLRPDGSVADSGEVVEIEPHKRLVLKWQNHMFPEMTAEGFSRMTYEIEQKDDSVKLTVTHEMEKNESKLIEQGIEWVAADSLQPEELAGDGGVAGVDTAVAEGNVSDRGRGN